jgi:hypothetical protein
VATPPYVIEESSDTIAGRAPDVSLKLLRELRNGELPIQARLDLHGRLRDEAVRGVERFVAAARARRKGRARHSWARPQLGRWGAGAAARRLAMALEPCRGARGRAGVYVGAPAGRRPRRDLDLVETLTSGQAREPSTKGFDEGLRRGLPVGEPGSGEMFPVDHGPTPKIVLHDASLRVGNRLPDRRRRPASISAFEAARIAWPPAPGHIKFA